MKVLIFILALVGCNAMSCGREPDVDPELKSLLGHYWHFAPNVGKYDLIESIKFGNVLDKGERGVCNIEKDQIKGKTWRETRTITIDPVGETGPIALTVYHELGHCLHDLPHSMGLYDIMNPGRSADKDYWTQEHIDEALRKMFEGK